MVLQHNTFMVYGAGKILNPGRQAKPVTPDAGHTVRVEKNTSRQK